jgi:uncharacterized protein
MAKIVISYRRTDSDSFSGRVRDRIVARYGETSVYMDIDNIPFGRDFREHVKDALDHCDVVVAIIGAKWLGSGKGGHSRINDETDPVRVEVEAALRLQVPVLPVLVGNTRMPKPGQLPATLEKLAYINAPSVDTGRDFHLHMDRVLRSIDQLLQTKSAAAVPAVGEIPTRGAPSGVEDDYAQDSLFGLKIASDAEPRPLQPFEPAPERIIEHPAATNVSLDSRLPHYGRYTAIVASVIFIGVAVSIAIIKLAPNQHVPVKTQAVASQIAAPSYSTQSVASVSKTASAGDVQVSTFDKQPATATHQASLPPEITLSSDFRGPSFSCTQTTQVAERTICGSAQLAAKDRLLADIYIFLRERLDSKSRDAFVESQRNWLATRNRCTGTDSLSCVNRAYDLRIGELKMGPSFNCVTDQGIVEQAICNNALLSLKDQKMADQYFYVRSRASQGVKQSLLERQRLWLHNRDQCDGSDIVACINKAYDAWLFELERLVQAQ